MMEAVRSRWREMSLGRRRVIRGVLGVALGSAVGLAYYQMVGCSTGSCPITSDPVVSTLWGGAIGGFWALG